MGDINRLPTWYLAAIRVVYTPVIGALAGGVAAGVMSASVFAASHFDLRRIGESIAASFFIFLLGGALGMFNGAVCSLFVIPLLYIVRRQVFHDALAVGAVAGVMAAFLYEWPQGDPKLLGLLALILPYIVAASFGSSAVVWFCGKHSKV